MTRVVGKLLILALLLLALSVLAIGCGPPPGIAEEDVVGFWVGAWDVPHEVWDAPALPPPTQSLDRLIAAYNASEAGGWHVYTTPSLFALIETADGMRTMLYFSGEYPEGGAKVQVWDSETEEKSEYRIDSPDLLTAVWELLTEDEREQLRREPGPSWVPD